MKDREKTKKQLMNELEEMRRRKNKMKAAQSIFMQPDEQLRLLSIAVEQSPSMIMITDLEGNIEYVNSKFTELTGYTLEEVKGKNFRVLKSGEAFTKTYQQFWETIASCGEWRGEFQNKKKSGKLFWVFASISGIKDPEGNITHYLVIEEAITERTRADEALRDSGKLLKATIESTADGILVVDETGQVTVSNARFAEMWRIPDELIESKNDRKLLDYVLNQLVDPEAFRSKVQKLYQILEEDFDTILFKDGRVFERFSCPLVRDGQIAGRVWSFRDITHYMQTEEALRASKERFQSLTEKTSDWIWEVDRNGIYTYSSPKVEDLLGYKPNEIIGKTPFDLMPPEEAKKIAAEFGTIVKSKKSFERLENINLHKNGRLVMLETSGVPIFDSDGKLSGYRGIDRDITERKLAENRLIQLNRTFLELGPDHEKNIQKLTDTCGELFGATCALYNRLDKGLLCSAGQWNTSPDYNPVDKPDGHICYDVIKRGKKGGVYIVRNLPKSPYYQTDPNVASYKLNTYIGYPVNCFGQSIGSLCVVYQKDVSFDENEIRIMGILATAIGFEEERKHAEDALEESRKQLQIAERLAATGQLSASIAHEISNPLQAILANLGAFEKTLPPDYKHKIRLEKIKIGTKRIKETIKQLLDIHRSKVTAEEKINVNEVIESTLNLLENQLLINNIKVKKNLTADASLILGLTQELFQVFMNIILNAIDAMEEGGVLKISSKVENEKLHIEFEDNGYGISAKDIDHIFEPFYTTKSEILGTGLGLSTSKGIVESFGGDIKVKTRNGQGTTFLITFPTLT